MKFSDIEHAFQLQAARGNLRDEHVGLMSVVTAAEMGATAFGKAYFGPIWGKAERDVQARRVASEAKDTIDDLIVKWERHASDVRNLPAALARETIVTTLDLPATLGRARDLTLRAAEEPINTDSPLMAAANKVTRSDFREASSIKQDIDTLGLFAQPEGTNVRYEAFTYSEDKYAVSKFSRAIGWTFEAKVNDDLTRFLDQAAALGFAARLNRLRLLFTAIVNGTSRSTPSGTMPSGGTAAAGGPTIANIEWATKTLANNAPPRRFGGVSIPIPWVGLANVTLGNQFVPASSPAVINPAYNTFTVGVEEAMSEVLAAASSGNALDWLAYDAAVTAWLDFAALAGFEAAPRIAFKLPDVRDATDLGSFDNMTDAMKVVDVVASKVTDTTRVLRIAGA